MNSTTSATLESERFHALRVRADELNNEVKKLSPTTDEKVARLLRELGKFQIELELQNDDLRQSQIAQQALSNRYKRLYDDAPVGYFVLDANGKIIEANNKLCELLNCRNLVGTSLSSIVFDKDQDNLSRSVDQFLTSTSYSLNVRLNADPDLLWVRLDTHTVGGDDTGPVQVLGTVTDITELRQAEHERRVIEKGMHKAQKLESLGVLAGGIAHDFNNLLMIISGNIELMMRQMPKDMGVYKQLETIELATDRAAALSRQMLSYSGRGVIETTAVDLNKAVRDILRLIESSVTKAATMDMQLESDIPPIEGDEAQVAQVIMNLVINAADALGKDSGLITIKTYRTSSNICLEVSDTGCGMSQETREKMFDPFYTTKFVGRGLGMSAVLGILNSFNAHIQVQSTLGKGSKISVHFGISDTPVLVTVKKPIPPDWNRSGLILVVDDEEPIRNLYRQILTDVGYDVIMARDGLEAIKIFIVRGDRIDAVVMDLTMPKMNGARAAEIIRSRNRDVPIFIASGYIEDTTDLRSNPHTGFIQKPCSARGLIATLDKVLKGSD